MATLRPVSTPAPESPAPTETGEPVQVEPYKAPEYIFPKKDPAKQEGLDALIQAISSFKDVQYEDPQEDDSLDDKKLKKFAKILKLLQYEQ
jgi:hypothetical protein